MNRRLLTIILSAVLLLVSCSKKPTPATSTENNAQPANPDQTAKESTSSTSMTPATPEPSPPQQAPPQAAVKTPPPAPPHVAPKPPEPVVIPAGTIVTIKLQQEVSSKSSHTGDRFEASVAQPLVIKGRTVVPTGAAAGGTVTDAKSAGRFKGGATLNLALDTLIVQGTRYQVQAMPTSQTSKGKGKRSATMIGGGAGAGALIGGLAGGGKGAAIGALVGGGAGTAGAGMTGNNNDITLPAEAAVAFQLTAPLTLKPMPPTTEARE